MTAISMEQSWGLNATTKDFLASSIKKNDGTVHQKTLKSSVDQSLLKADQAQMDKAAKKLDHHGNIIPETDEELMALVRRLEEDQLALVSWQHSPNYDPKMNGDKN